MVYKLQITDQAEQDLDGILSYLIDELSNMQAALDLADEVEQHYGLLLENPHLYEECHQPLLRKAHHRKVVLGGYLMIYRIDEERGAIYIERFFSDLQDYSSKL